MKHLTNIPTHYYFGLLILAWAIFTLPFLGFVPLFDYDETIYAQTALDMMQQHEWIVPTANGLQFFEKPPFTYYLMDLCFSTFGTNAFSARLPSAIFTLFTALLLFRFGRNFHSPAFGATTALIFLSMFEVSVLAHAAILDAVLNFFIAACLLSYFNWLQTHHIKYARWCAVLMGAAVSIKGPVGAVVPVLIILADRLLAGELWQTLRRIPWLTALVLFFLAATPWYLMILIEHGSAFLYEFIWVQNIGRAMNPMQGHGGGWHYYIVVFIISVLPWLAWMPWLFKTALSKYHRHIVKHDTGSSAHLIRLSLLWVIIVVGLFTFAQTKLPHYISCVYPAVALALSAAWWQQKPDAHTCTRIRWATIMVLTPVAIALIAFPFIYPMLEQWVHHPRALAILAQDIAPSMLISIAGIVLLFALIWLQRSKQHLLLRFIALGFILQSVLLIPLGSFAGKLVQGPQTQIAEALRHLPEDIDIFSYNLNFPSISFQSQRAYHIMLNQKGRQTIAAQNKPIAIIMRSESLPDFSWLHIEQAQVNQGGFLLFVINPREQQH